MKKIPSKYLFEYDSKYDTFFREELSPTIQSLRALTLEQTPCPVCLDCNLRIGNFGPDSMFPDYRITCDSCEFTCPSGSSDYGEAKFEFERWAEAFYLLGKPTELLNDPYAEIYLYKKGESRNIALKRFTGDSND